MTYTSQVPPREIYATIDCTDDGENGFPRFRVGFAQRELWRPIHSALMFPDHLGPLRGFCVNEFPEISGRTGKRRAGVPQGTRHQHGERVAHSAIAGTVGLEVIFRAICQPRRVPQ